MNTFRFHFIFTLLFCTFLLTPQLFAQDMDSPFLDETQSGQLRLNTAGASHFANLALHCVQQEFPNKLGHVIMDSSKIERPKVLHPAFYGCFDWHSSVHGHWMLSHLLKRFPEMPEAVEIRKKLNENLTAENIAGEVAYFNSQGAKAYERMYGWSWLMKMSEELHLWSEDEDAQKWAKNLQPLTDLIVERYLEFLPRQDYPIRVGTHTNTAFGLSFAWDYAIATQHESLKNLIASRAQDYFLQDADCPADWEPSGADFLSPCLEEADLMRRVLEPEAFNRWFAEFLPADRWTTLKIPAKVSDRSDPYIVHLDGVNLSRGWCIFGISTVLDNETQKAELMQSAYKHIGASLPHIASGDYAGEHWLASFAVYALSAD